MSELKETAFSRFVKQYEKYNGSAVNDDNSFTSDFTIYTFAQYERLLNTRPNDAKAMIAEGLDSIQEDGDFVIDFVMEVTNKVRSKYGEDTKPSDILFMLDALLEVCKQSSEEEMMR